MMLPTGQLPVNYEVAEDERGFSTTRTQHRLLVLSFTRLCE